MGVYTGPDEPIPVVDGRMQCYLYPDRCCCLEAMDGVNACKCCEAQFKGEALCGCIDGYDCDNPVTDLKELLEEVR